MNKATEMIVWKDKEKGAEGTYRIQKEQVEFAIFIDFVGDSEMPGPWAIMIDAYFDLFDMKTLTEQLNRSIIFSTPECKTLQGTEFEYVGEEHKLYETFGEGIVHITQQNSLRDAKYYAESLINSVRKTLKI